MNIAKILSELRSKREAIDQALMALVPLATGAAKRRGRPPKWMTRGVGDTETPPYPRKARTFSEEARQRMAEGQRKRWAAKREEAEKKNSTEDSAQERTCTNEVV